MKIVITVVGADKVGIIAGVTRILADKDVNILSINQNIIDGIFNMVMICEAKGSQEILLSVQEELAALAKEKSVQVQAQHMDIFTNMHLVD